MKSCNKCLEYKELECFHKNKRSSDGRKGTCKDETQKRLAKHRDRLNEEKRKWYRESKSRRDHRNEVALSVQFKKCSGCLENKNPSCFYLRTNGGLQNICKECWAEKAKRYASENTEKVREWKRIREQRRRALIKDLPSDFNSEDWSNCLSAFGNACAYCGEKSTKLTQDHVVPVSKGGGYTADNIIPACFSCNTRKHNSDMLTWYQKQVYYTPDRLQEIVNYL